MKFYSLYAYRLPVVDLAGLSSETITLSRAYPSSMATTLSTSFVLRSIIILPVETVSPLAKQKSLFTASDVIQELVFPLFISNIKQLTVIKHGFRISTLSNKYDSLFSNA
jgi:hypothetical protein